MMNSNQRLKTQSCCFEKNVETNLFKSVQYIEISLFYSEKNCVYKLALQCLRFELNDVHELEYGSIK